LLTEGKQADRELGSHAVKWDKFDLYLFFDYIQSCLRGNQLLFSCVTSRLFLVIYEMLRLLTGVHMFGEYKDVFGKDGTRTTDPALTITAFRANTNLFIIS
jgi:hypothetical protein